VDVVDDDVRRIAVVTDRGDVERLVVEGDPHLGGFGGRLALERIGLHEVIGGRSAAPDVLVEHAVNGHRAGEAHRSDRAAPVQAAGPRRLCRHRRHQEHGHDRRRDRDSYPPRRHRRVVYLVVSRRGRGGVVDNLTPGRVHSLHGFTAAEVPRWLA
jgi:hypothetical protein